VLDVGKAWVERGVVSGGAGRDAIQGGRDAFRDSGVICADGLLAGGATAGWGGGDGDCGRGHGGGAQGDVSRDGDGKGSARLGWALTLK